MALDPHSLPKQKEGTAVMNVLLLFKLLRGFLGTHQCIRTDKHAMQARLKFSFKFQFRL